MTEITTYCIMANASTRESETKLISLKCVLRLSKYQNNLFSEYFVK